ncbi:MAG: YifB family Mg chelatase-like AAA ATPase [Lachnospiraceae bacterium]|nr:YifB family Mg chelatase-like AAA ATPase [Lachnospiraceae bacterium]MBP3569809.1 YifB family Mg chelatase-like AAA ATPase [Lachnospiraceae bacterium]
MVCKTYSAVLCGMEAVKVQVETDVRSGLPQLQMVGALASEVKEARERVRVAIENSGFRLPPKHITINLSPADIRKEGTSFDLATAISILAAFGFIPEEQIQNCMFAGELSLDGTINKVSGILPMAKMAATEGFQKMIVPAGNLGEAALQNEVPVYGMNRLTEVVDFLLGNINKEAELPMSPIDLKKIQNEKKKQIECDLKDIIGQTAAKRALMIAAAGGHHLLMIGPPGSGKTALAKCMPSLLPDLSFEEMIDLSNIYSVSGKLKNDMEYVVMRPFQAPHHATTPSALLGGGRNANPGLVSLCHHGVLFLDELTEFKPEVLETLRQPLEDHTVTVSRLQATYTYPAAFQLIAAMNPCPCGHFPDRTKCNCSPQQIRRYTGKISQPILDRIDMMIEVFPVEYEKIRKKESSETSECIREKVVRARKIQKKRFEKKKIQLNSEMGKRETEEFCTFDKEAEQVLHLIFQKNEFSTRRYYRILKLARTIADLDGSPEIRKHHLTEAYSYCNVGKKYWRMEA